MANFQQKICPKVQGMVMLKLIKKTYPYKILRNLYLSTLSDEDYFLRCHKKAFGTTPDFKNPQTFNEKIVHRILYDRNLVYTLLADKIKARLYIASKLLDQTKEENQAFLSKSGGSENVLSKDMPIYEPINEIKDLLLETNLCEYLPKLYGIWDNVEEIDFGILPQSFVLKTNHDGGGVVIVKNKNDFLQDSRLFKTSMKKLTKHLRTNWYSIYREYHYKDIEPKVFAEELLVEADGKVLDDYKIHTFDDEMFSETIIDRGVKTRCTFFNKDWQPQDVEITFDFAEREIPRPKCLDKMFEICRIFHKDCGYLRLDYYVNRNSRFWIGELTLTSGGGCLPIRPKIWDKKLGEFWIND